MHALIRTLFVGVLLALGSTAMVAAADAKDPIFGTWTLDVANSTFSPGPAPKSQTRTYTATADGITMTVTGHAADGTDRSSESTFKLDGKDYPITGSPDYDTLSLKRVDNLTVESTQKKGGKAVGTTLRTVAKDGKVLTLHSKGTSATGIPYENVMVFERQ
jgi:hypothetical protein